MKQKNLILMVVAVGCGLVAAFLTTQINAKPKVEKVEVLGRGQGPAGRHDVHQGRARPSWSTSRRCPRTPCRRRSSSTRRS